MTRRAAPRWLTGLALLWFAFPAACGDDDSSGNNTNQNNQAGLCGDGVLDTGEQCDDGTANSDTQSDACRTDCRTAYCGDTVADQGEACDGPALRGQACESLAQGYDGGNLLCADDCTLDTSECATCGNGIAEPGEACDGIDTGGDTCATVELKQHGVLRCNPDCTFDSALCHTCGDGVMEGPEECDASDLGSLGCLDVGFDSGELGCTFLCVFDTRNCGTCGNGIVELGEACDDANFGDWDGCRTCQHTDFLVNTTLASHQWRPDVAIDDSGRFTVVWEGGGDIWHQRYNHLGLPGGPEVRVNTDPVLNAKFPTVAQADNGRFMVAWQVEEAGEQKNIYARRYSNGGYPVNNDPEFKVNTTTSGHQSRPDLAMAGDGRFVIVWHCENREASGTYGIAAQRYDASAQKVGGELLVNTTTDGHQMRPAVAMTQTGDFMVAWYTQEPGDTVLDVAAQRFLADGQLDGPELLVNTYTTGDQYRPDVALANGGWSVVVWASDGQDGDGWGVFGQRFDDQGLPAGSEFQVNTTTSANQGSDADAESVGPSVGMADDHSFVVTWYSDDQGPTNREVYARRYDTLGTPAGGEFKVNDYAISSQHNSRVAVAGDGRFALVWQTYAPFGGEYETFGQKYSASGARLGLSTW